MINLGRFLRQIKRRMLIRYYGLKFVHNTFFATFGLKQVAKDVHCGRYSYIGPNSIIYPKVTIGDFTMIANNVSIIGSDHNFKTVGVPIIFNGREELKPTIIGKDCWIGAHSIIMAGVRIGDGVIVAAGSVVTKDLEEYGVYAGTPAKRIKDRFNSAAEIEIHKEMLCKPFDNPSMLSSARVWRKKLK